MTNDLQDTPSQQTLDNSDYSEQVFEHNNKPSLSPALTTESTWTDEFDNTSIVPHKKTKTKKNKNKSKKLNDKSKQKSKKKSKNIFKYLFELIFSLIFADSKAHKSKDKNKKHKLKSKNKNNKNATFDMPEGISTDASEDNSTEVAESISTDASEDNSTEVAEGISTDASEDNSTEVAESISTDASEDNSTEVAEGISTDASEDNSTEVAEGISTDASEDNSTEVAESISTNMPEDTSNIKNKDKKKKKKKLKNKSKKKSKKKFKKKLKNKLKNFFKYIFEFIFSLISIKKSKDKKSKGKSKGKSKKKNKKKINDLSTNIFREISGDMPEDKSTDKSINNIPKKSTEKSRKNAKVKHKIKNGKNSSIITKIDIIIIIITILIIVMSQIDIKKFSSSKLENIEENQNEHTNSIFETQLNSEIFNNTSANNKELEQAQDILITYVQSPEKERIKLHNDLKKALAIIESQIQTCPGHLVFLAQWIRQELGKDNEINTLSPWQKGCYDYIINDKNLAKDLLACKKMSSGERQERVNTPFIKISGRLFGEGRGQQLLDIICSSIPQNKLKGIVVADLRGDLGMFAATLAPIVQPGFSKGKVIFIEQNKDYLDFCKHMSKYVHQFAKLDLRLESDTPNLGLKENEADIACAFDCNYFDYIHYSSKDQNKKDLIQQEKEKRKEICKKIYNGLKPNGEFLIYDFEETAPAKDIMESLKEVGFMVSIKKNKDLNSQIKREMYLITAKKP